MKAGDRVYVVYGGYAMPKSVYRGKLKARLVSGEWLVRERWSTTLRVVPEHRIAKIEEDA